MNIKSKGRNYFSRNFLESWNYIKKSKNYIWFATGIFVLAILTALIFPVPSLIDENIKELIKKLVEVTANLDTIQLIFYIFFNNLIIGITGLIFGIFFCVVPFFLALTNGYVLGYVIKKLIIGFGLSDGILSLWRLLPHGIFELPAVMISLGIGIKLGVDFIKALNENSFKRFSEKFMLSIKTIFFIILPLLFIAAIIEGILIGLLG